MKTFQEWKAWYESQAEPADPIDGASLYFEPAHGFFYYKVFLEGCCTLTTLPRMTTSIFSGGRGRWLGASTRRRASTCDGATYGLGRL